MGTSAKSNGPNVRPASAKAGQYAVSVQKHSVRKLDVCVVCVRVYVCVCILCCACIVCACMCVWFVCVRCVCVCVYAPPQKKARELRPTIANDPHSDAMSLNAVRLLLT